MEVLSGSYATVETLVNANPETGVYIVQEDGHVYSWTKNAENAIDLGVYQATEVDDFSIKNINLASDSITRDKLNLFENILYKAIKVYKNKKLIGYDTTTKLPLFADDNNSSCYVFYSNDVEGTVFYLNTNSVQAIVKYTENVKGTNVTTDYFINTGGSYSLYDSIANEAYTSVNNDDYEKTVICLENNHLYVKKKNTIDFSKLNAKDIVGKLSGNQMNLERINLLEYASFINCKCCEGYDISTHLPIFKNSVNFYIADISLEKLKDGFFDEIYFKVPDLSKQSNYTQGVVAYTENVIATPQTYKQLKSSNYYDGTTGYVRLDKVFSENIGITLKQYEHLIIVCDYNDDLPIYCNVYGSDNPNFKIFNKNEFEKVECILNSKFKVVNNNKLLLYPQNFTKNINTKNVNLIEIPTFSYNFKDCLVYIPKTVQNKNHSLNYYFLNNNTINLSKTINIETIDENAGNGLTKKILFIGDSLTDAGVYPKRVKELFENDVMNIELIGTLDNNTNEGRSGWRAYTYTHCANGSDESTAGGFYQGSNAFWNPDTSKFDFDYYMNNNAFEGVDYVFINLGTNDISRGNYQTESNIISFYNIMISSIKAYNSNIKIGLWLPPARGIGNNIHNIKTRDAALKMNEYLINNFENREEDNIYLIPINVSIDPDNDYNTNNCVIDDSHSIECITDIVHPKQSGYFKIAEIFYYWIKYFSTLS